MSLQLFREYQKRLYVQLKKKKTFVDTENIPLEIRIGLLIEFSNGFWNTCWIKLSEEDITQLIYEELKKSKLDELKKLTFPSLGELSLDETKSQALLPLYSSEYEDQRRRLQMSTQGKGWSDIVNDENILEDPRDKSKGDTINSNRKTTRAQARIKTETRRFRKKIEAAEILLRKLAEEIFTRLKTAKAFFNILKKS